MRNRRRKLERFFPVEVSAFRACSENESQRQSEQTFHFCPPSEPARILPQHALDEGGKRNGLEMRVAELLISDRDGTNRPVLRIGGARGKSATYDVPCHHTRCRIFKDWKSAAVCDHRSKFWTGRPQPCARQRRCRVPYRVRRVRSTTSRWLARG